MVVVTPEQPAKVGFVDMTLGRNLFQGPQLPAVLFDMLPAVLVGCERVRLSSFEGRMRSIDTKSKTF